MFAMTILAGLIAFMFAATMLASLSAIRSEDATNASSKDRYNRPVF